MLWMIEAIYEKVLSTYLMSSTSWDEKLRVMASKILKQKLEILFCVATKYLMLEPVTFQVDNLGQFVVLWRKADRVLSVGNLLVRKDGKVGKCWFQIADLLFTYKIIAKLFQVRVTQNYGLELNNVEPGDEGQYSCQLDVFGETQTALHNLTVLGEIIF